MESNTSVQRGYRSYGKRAVLITRSANDLERACGKFAKRRNISVQNDLVGLADATQQLYLDLEPWHTRPRQQLVRRRSSAQSRK